MDSTEWSNSCNHCLMGKLTSYPELYYKYLMLFNLSENLHTIEPQI